MRNRNNSVIYGGTNTILSREALEAAGGFFVGVITEDFATGMMIQAKGFKSFAINEGLAVGMAPEDLKSLINQRRRWARGCIQTGKKINLLFVQGLDWRQKVSYLTSITYWLSPVHYYGDWSFSNNVGYPLFDEVLPNTRLTQRQLKEDFIQRLLRTFTTEGIGVVIGEYGLLGYDRSTQVNPWSETHKFIAHLNSLTRYQPISLFIWDNGQHFDRTKLVWYQEAFGELQRQAMYSDSAYVNEFGTTYREMPQADEFISLVYNGTTVQQVLFNGDVLQLGQDYEVNEEGLYLYPNVLRDGGTLTLKFSQGATWNQQIINVGQLEMFSFSTQLDQHENNEGTAETQTDADFESGNSADDYADVYFDEAMHDLATNPALESSVQIPLEFSGHDIKRVQLSGDKEYYQMLTYLEDYQPNQATQQLELSTILIASLEEGSYQLKLETYSGYQVSYQLSFDGQTLIGKPN